MAILYPTSKVLKIEISLKTYKQRTYLTIVAGVICILVFHVNINKPKPSIYADTSHSSSYYSFPSFCFSTWSLLILIVMRSNSRRAKNIEGEKLQQKTRQISAKKERKETPDLNCSCQDKYLTLETNLIPFL